MTSAFGSRWVCSGCGKILPQDEPLPFRCPRSHGDDDVDHVLRCELEFQGTLFPELGPENPFLRFRALSHSWRMARRMGMTDASYMELVSELDRAVEQVASDHEIARGAAATPHGFEITPYRYVPELGLSVKDETGQIAGSHKSRHLMGVAIHLAVVDELAPANTQRRRLATFSCGNAALAAAVVAKAAGRPLVVFVPDDADAGVIELLSGLGAEVVRCERVEGESGDPSAHAFRRAVRGGCLPFTCQGSDCALALEGGRTLGYELAAQQKALRSRPIDRLFLQVGGGALASSVIQGLHVALTLGKIPNMPRICAVQSELKYPMVRAFRRFMHIADIDPVYYAPRHRSQFMEPWPDVRSSATGILDDETYDWYAIARAMHETDGTGVLVDEDTFERARAVGREVAGCPEVSVTGAAGLAGVLTMRAATDLPEHTALGDQEEVAVILTGVR